MERDDEANFARKMIELRERWEMSQSEVARKMVERGFDNYSQMTVSRTEKGERPIRLGEARVLAEVLGSSLELMMRGTHEEEFLGAVEKTQAAISTKMFDAAFALWDYADLTSDIDHLRLALSTFDRETESDSRRALETLEELRFPVSAVALWAAEMVAAGRDLTDRELLHSDVQRLKRLAGDYGKPEATA
ncbi:helix-turn-helix transcriptional regulator [Microbacterium sp. NPDC089696]|uniref:helix-turn-helix transcriptional regulator n=1 Tax=Microbacterium sp. NPDC089696 TaxID=3364199 RepID=UPI0037F3EBA5